MAYWYKVKTASKSTFNNDVPNNDISLDEEQNKSNLLWNFYRKMISIRKANPVISKGTYKALKNGNDGVFSFMRYEGKRRVNSIVIHISAYGIKVLRK